MTPTGTDMKKTARQLHSESSPPPTRPMNDPASAATWLMPSASPRCVVGKASVTIAVEFAISIAPPTPCTTRQAMSQSAPAPALSGSRARAIEPRVNTAKPAL